MEADAQEAIDQVILIATTYGLDILGAIAILIFGWIASKWAGHATEKALARSKRIDLTLQRFFATLVRYAIIVFTIVATLQQFGVETTSLLAVLGAAGLAIGLALQGTLSNVAAGVMLLIFRPFKIGDYVDAGSCAGTVENMSLFVTELRAPDGVYIICPNSDLWGTPLTNYSRNPTRRIQIVLGIDYEDDMDLAIATAQKVISEEPRALAEPAPQVVVAEMGESSINLYVRVWTNTADYWGAFFSLTKALKAACDEAGITIPFPQRTLHFESGSPSPELSQAAAPATPANPGPPKENEES